MKKINKLLLAVMSASVLTYSTVQICYAEPPEKINVKIDTPQVNKNSFWRKTSEGYWWYKQPPEKKIAKKKKKEEPKPKVEPQVAKVEPPKEEKPEEPKEQAPVMFSADWVKENLDVYRKVAWDNPTVENLRAYLYLQRFAIDRSEQFAYAGRMAVEGDPYLDESARSPIGGAANRERKVMIDHNQAAVLSKIYSKVGIFFVFKNNCYICQLQAEVLQGAKVENKMSITAVSIDQPSKDNPVAKMFPDYVVNPDIVSKLKIRALPASFFFDSTTKEIKPLVQGYVTISDLNQRTLTAAQKYNWLSKEEFDIIKPFDTVTSLSSTLSTDSDLASRLVTLKEEKNPYGKDTNYVSPSVLVKEIQKTIDSEIDKIKDFAPRGY